MQEWRRHFFYRKESIKTTWKLRVATLVVVILTGVSTRGVWVPQIGRSLVCVEELAPSDMILVENVDLNYLLFERAAALERVGIAPTTLVLVEASRDPEVANPVSRGVAELMARQARLGDWKIILFRETEPITLNAAAQVREHLAGEHIKSLIVVTSGFRSRRSSLVYRAMLGDVGIQVHCAPVFGRKTTERWAETWHGIQEVAAEFLKLQYYRFYVLPFVSRSGRR
jgi:uncharacterized SAM-binding protein YcdF (DUF218 family)